MIAAARVRGIAMEARQRQLEKAERIALRQLPVWRKFVEQRILRAAQKGRFSVDVGLPWRRRVRAALWPMLEEMLAEAGYRTGRSRFYEREFHVMWD